MSAFYPEGYHSGQLKKSAVRVFSLAVTIFGFIVILAPILFSSLMYLGGSAEVQETPEVLGESIVSAEEHFVEYGKYGSTVSVEERDRIIQKVSSQISSRDTRSLALHGYLETMQCSNGSIPPLADYSEELVDSADKYGLDWKIIPAISGVETWFGCAGDAESYRNAWGMGGGPSNRYRFDTWEEGIDVYAKMLADGYGTDVHTRLYDVASLYVYGHAGRHDKWADGVMKYFNGIEQFYLQVE